ncbi:MAG: L,D-transpeptidase [Alphaproteobacteria bacterium]
MEKRRLIVVTSVQKAILFFGRNLKNIYDISTSAKGLGCEIDSNKTPTGIHKIAAKIGKDEPIGTVFDSRIPTGEVWSSDGTNPPSLLRENLILTRILWLEGTEPQNQSTYERYIYIHGTSREDKIGQPNSHGCICMKNIDIIQIFDQLHEGDEVVIV